MKETHIAALKNFIFDKKPLSQDEFYGLRKDLEDLIKLNYTEQNISKSLILVVSSSSKARLIARAEAGTNEVGSCR